MGAFYAFFYFIFMYLMRGMDVGSLRMSNLCLSHGLAAAAANVCIYLETVLLSCKICKCPAIDMSDVCGYAGDPAVGDLFGKAVPASGENCTFAVSGV